jgi:DNA primase
MKITREIIENIKEANPIQDIAQEFISSVGGPFKYSGTSIFTHHHIWRDSGSMGQALFITPENQMWHCFSCKQTGDVITLVQSFLFGDETDFRNKNQRLKAIGYLANRADIEIGNTDEFDEGDFELTIIYAIYRDFIDYCFKNSYTETRKETVLGFVQDRYPLNWKTIEKYKICYFDRDWTAPFYNKLLEKYSHEELLSSGLFQEYNNEITCYYQNRILIPYLQSGEVIYMVGREVRDQSGFYEGTQWFNYDRGGKFKKIPVHSDKNPNVSKYITQNHIFGLDSLKRKQDVIITEGYGDCLTLLQEGYNCISPGTTSFKRSIMDTVSKELSKSKNIYICNDSELSGAGEQGALTIYEYLVERGIDAKVITLPLSSGQTKIDVSDFFKEHTNEDFRSLIEQAKSFITIEIEKLPQKFHKLDIEPIWNKILSLSALEQDLYKQKLAKQVGLSVKKLNDALGSKKQNSISSKILFKVEKTIIPAIDFYKDENSKKAFTTVYLPVEESNSNGETIEMLMPFLLTSEVKPDGSIERDTRNLVDSPLSPLEMKKVPDQNIFNRWRVDEDYPYSVANFILGDPPRKPSIEDIYTRIYKLFDDYFWYPNDCEKMLQSVYIIMTYFHTMFSALPILHFTGLFGAGKSNSMKLAELMGFNAISTYNVNPPFIFRSSHSKRCTLIVDEGEDFNGDNPTEKVKDIMTLLRGRYKKGLSVPRTEKVGDTFQDIFYESFGPSLVGTTKPLEQGLSTRSIIIQCRKKDSSVQLKDFITYDDQIQIECEEIRDQLYTLMMLDFDKVFRSVEEMKTDHRIKHIINREREKWFPLFVIANYIDTYSKKYQRNLVKNLIEIQELKEQLRIDVNTSSNQEVYILDIILSLINSSTNIKEATIKIKKISDDIYAFPCDAFYSKINIELRKFAAQKEWDMLSRSAIDQVLRQTQVWGVGEGQIIDGKVQISKSKLQQALDLQRNG